jgi:hypothetical protein
MIVEARLSIGDSDPLFKDIDIPEVLLQKGVIFEGLLTDKVSNDWEIVKIAFGTERYEGKKKVVSILLELNIEIASEPSDEGNDLLWECAIADGWAQRSIE